MQGLFKKQGKQYLIKDGLTGQAFIVKGITGDITAIGLFRDLRPWTGQSGVAL
ncbi:hypothetical protein PITCH_A70002 [uncultured Desulfobacterium sp.]|uniref:Uncharacterized protein n=1 Tax=uncultured Desulfobacterium sp. TaxID=201089 RepID=A0A445N1P9_9BACT|nr:hypothetical protein PITCH_A70002 [uncultured Desulfobacterium sp.]